MQRYGLRNFVVYTHIFKTKLKDCFLCQLEGLIFVLKTIFILVESGSWSHRWSLLGFAKALCEIKAERNNFSVFFHHLELSLLP